MLPEPLIDLSVKIGSLSLKNPVLTAAGTFGYGEEYAPFFDLNQLGAICTKTITLKPRSGNPPPRLWETPSGLINSVGLENCGLERFIEEKLPFLAQYSTPIIASIYGENEEEFCLMAEALGSDERISALEVNLSCPNLNLEAGMVAQSVQATYSLLWTLRHSTPCTLLAKLSPNVTDIREVAVAAQEAGVDGLCLINTYNAMALDLKTRKTTLGGLSGPCIKPLALRAVFEASQGGSIPLIGMGGICSLSDALEFFMAGADAIAIGSITFLRPTAAIEILQGLRTYLLDNHLPSLYDLKVHLRSYLIEELYE